MAVNYTITLTDTEKKCMDYVTTDIQAWIENSVKNRARKAQNLIVAGKLNIVMKIILRLVLVLPHRWIRHMKIKLSLQLLKLVLQVNTH